MEISIDTDDIEVAVSEFVGRGREVASQVAEQAQSALEHAKSAAEPHVENLAERMGRKEQRPLGRYIAVAAVVVGVGVGVAWVVSRRRGDAGQSDEFDDTWTQSPPSPDSGYLLATATEDDSPERDWTDEGGSTPKGPATNVAADPPQD